LNTQKQIFLIVVLFFILVGGCAAYSVIDLPIRSERQTDFFQSESVKRGALLFANNCRTCHGIQGQGGVGLPLNKADFQDQDPLKLKANRDLLKRTIYCGRAGTLMPAWLNTNGGSLNDRQIDHIIDLITSPVSEQYKDADGNPTSKGWLEAVDFAHNLNRESSAIVGGDTLDIIATNHQIGYKELADANGLAIDSPVAKGTTVNLPDGRRFKVIKDNQTVAKVADDQHVGAVILATLNKVQYRIDSKTGQFVLLGDDGNPVPGLFPGDKLALPDGAVYAIQAGDTVESIATQHGITVSTLTSQNSKLLSGADATKALDFERKLKLPSNAVIVVAQGQTLAVLATRHALKPDDLISANAGLTADAVLTAGQQLKLPANAVYVVQPGDTLKSAAAAHGVSVDDLAKANDLQPTDVIGPQVLLKLPKIDAYVVKGDSLETIAKVYSNVTAASLGEANGVPADAVLRIGQTLKLPEDAWGTAPPDTKNAGTACVEHAVPASVYQSIIGAVTPTAAPTAPATVSEKVTIDAAQKTPGFDWTVSADGVAQDPNKGVVAIKKGASIDFTNTLGLHTVTLNGKKDDGDFKQGDKRTIAFNDTGTFKITCDYHPDMLAWVFVQ
jgi:LysM repeat protein